ncbi:MAG: hypothetical protein ACO2Z3_06510, partial [Flavobacteriaceae bacterium]
MKVGSMRPMTIRCLSFDYNLLEVFIPFSPVLTAANPGGLKACLGMIVPFINIHFSPVLKQPVFYNVIQ